MNVWKIICKVQNPNAPIQKHLILSSSKYHYNTDNGQALNTAGIKINLLIYTKRLQ